jgi:hypothetical protein
MQIPGICPGCGAKIEVPATPRETPGPAPIVPAPPHESQSPAPAAPPEIRIAALAACLSFLFPGWGQWYNGKTWDGLKFCLGTLVVYILAIITVAGGFRPLPQVLGIVLGIVTLAIWIYGIYDAYRTAQRINSGEEPFSGKSRLFWLPIVLVILVIVLSLLSVILAIFVFGLAGNISHPKVVAVTAYKPDAHQIVVTYQGGQDAYLLNRIVVKVTDSSYNTQTNIIGDMYRTTPLAVGSNTTFNGSFSGRDHVVATGIFTDNAEQLILDTYL